MTKGAGRGAVWKSLFGISLLSIFGMYTKCHWKKRTNRFKRFITTVTKVKVFGDSAQSACNLLKT